MNAQSDVDNGTFIGRFTGFFGRLIVQAHTVRNTRTCVFQALGLVQAPYPHVCTVMPILNCGHDYAAYLSLIWQDRWNAEDLESSSFDP